MKAETTSLTIIPAQPGWHFVQVAKTGDDTAVLFEPTPVIAWEIKRYDHRNREVGTRYSSRSNPDSLGRPLRHVGLPVVRSRTSTAARAPTPKPQFATR